MQFFQDFDLDDQTNADTPISLMEKGMIMALTLLAKLAARKAKKAQTYGDLYKLMNLIQGKVESMETKYDNLEEDEDEISEEKKQELAQTMIKDITAVADTLN